MSEWISSLPWCKHGRYGGLTVADFNDFKHHSAGVSERLHVCGVGVSKHAAFMIHISQTVIEVVILGFADVW